MASGVYLRTEVHIAANKASHTTPEALAKARECRIGEKNPMFGKHLTQEQKDAKRVVAVASWQNPECRAARIASLTGNHSNLGRKHTKEHNAKISRAVLGDNHPNWQGGISFLPYPPEFTRELKERIRERDNHTCQLCGVPQIECIEKLSVHHIDYDKDNIADENLISLCRSCNSKVNTNRDYWQDIFGGKIKWH